MCEPGRGEHERSRELPSRAEPSRAARCRGEAGRACPQLRTHRCCVSRLGVSLSLPRRPQNFYCLGLPPGCVTKSQRSAVSTLACSGDRGDVQPSPAAAGLLRSLRFLTCRSLPGTARGGPQRDRAGVSAPRHPVHRCGPARRNFNLIPVAHPGHPRRPPPPPPSLRSHKERGEGRRRGRRARASGLPRQKGNCRRSGLLFRPAVGSSYRPGLPLRLGPPRAVPAVLGPRELRGARRCCWSGL